MRKRTLVRPSVCAVLAGGCLFAGPCGITSLQLKDFLTSTLIRSGVTAATSLVEAAIIEGQGEADASGGG